MARRHAAPMVMTLAVALARNASWPACSARGVRLRSHLLLRRLCTLGPLNKIGTFERAEDWQRHRDYVRQRRSERHSIPHLRFVNRADTQWLEAGAIYKRRFRVSKPLAPLSGPATKAVGPLRNRGQPDWSSC